MSVFLLRSTNFNFAAPDFAFDAETSEQFEVEYDATSYPVELGAIVSDYVYIKPRVYSITGVVSHVSFDDPLSDPFTRRQSILSDLRTLAEDRELLSLVSPNWVDDSVIITKVRAHNDVDTGDAFEITIELQSIDRPEFLTVDIPPELIRMAVRADATKDAAGGAAAATEEAAGTAAGGKEKSWAASMADGENPFAAVTDELGKLDNLLSGLDG